MPIYEYVCDACGHQLEALQAISEEPLRECPDCQEAALRKKVSAVAFRLKGGGWYETDFKDRGKRNLAGDAAQAKTETQSGGKADDKSGGSSKTDTAAKPAASSATGGKPAASKTAEG